MFRLLNQRVALAKGKLEEIIVSSDSYYYSMYLKHAHAM